MDELMLFTDGSVNTKSKIGYGAYLAISDPKMALDSLLECVKVKRFEQTSSSTLELQTLLWALSDIQVDGFRMRLHTDSQNIIDLPRRRDQLEKSDYFSKNGKRLNNHLLYRQFFALTDKLDIKLIKVRGHLSRDQKSDTDKLFSLVDKASRRALRAASH